MHHDAVRCREMKITIDEKTEALLEGERAARGLRSPTAAAKAIIREAAEYRAYVSRGISERPDMADKRSSNLEREIRSLPGKAKKGRAK